MHLDRPERDDVKARRLVALAEDDAEALARQLDQDQTNGGGRPRVLMRGCEDERFGQGHIVVVRGTRGEGLVALQVVA